MTAEAMQRDDVLSALEHLAQHGMPSAEAVRLFDVGSESFASYFEREVLTELAAQGGATCKLIEGAYGSGKTHLLQLLESLALDRGLAVVRTDLSQALSLEDWPQIARHILGNIELRRDDGTIARSLPEVLTAAIIGSDVKMDVLTAGALPHAGFARAMRLFGDPASVRAGGRELLARYLSGERIGAFELSTHGVTGVKHPLSRRNAELVVKTVLGGLHRIGVRGTLLLFDENERTFVFNRSQPSKRILRSANLLRRFIDASTTGSLVGTVAVFAVLTDFVSNCALAYPALGQRLQRAGANEAVSWRSPLLPLDVIASKMEPEQFVDAFVGRVTTALEQCGVHVNGEQAALRRAGYDALQQQAGSGYRRQVVRTVASRALALL